MKQKSQSPFADSAKSGEIQGGIFTKKKNVGSVSRKAVKVSHFLWLNLLNRDLADGSPCQPDSDGKFCPKIRPQKYSFSSKNMTIFAN